MGEKKVMLWAGAGQIGMAIARRMGYGMKIIVGDIKMLVNAAGVSPSQAPIGKVGMCYDTTKFNCKMG